MNIQQIILLLTMTMLANNIAAQSHNADYVFMVEQAIKAPSGHNTQPWLFRLRDSSIEVHPNFEKSLPVVDFDNRELFISLGCAVENLCIAASVRGYASEVHTSTDGVISVSLTKEDNSVAASELFEQIPVRQTNRSVYSGKLIADDTLALLTNASLEGNVRLHCFKNGTEEFDTIASYVLHGNSIQMSDKHFTQELKHWMRFNRKHQNQTHDGLSYSAFGAPNLPLLIAKPAISGFLNPSSQNKGDSKKIRSSSHFLLLTTLSNEPEAWVNVGRSLQRLLLSSTQLGIANAFCNQPCELRELANRLAEYLQLENEHPVILLRVGYAERMPYSLRKSIDEVLMDVE